MNEATDSLDGATIAVVRTGDPHGTGYDRVLSDYQMALVTAANVFSFDALLMDNGHGYVLFISGFGGLWLRPTECRWIRFETDRSRLSIYKSFPVAEIEAIRQFIESYFSRHPPEAFRAKPSGFATATFG